jgi:hypothetical protein
VIRVERLERGSYAVVCERHNRTARASTRDGAWRLAVAATFCGCSECGGELEGGPPSWSPTGRCWSCECWRLRELDATPALGELRSIPLPASSSTLRAVDTSWRHHGG